MIVHAGSHACLLILLLGSTSARQGVRIQGKSEPCSGGSGDRSCSPELVDLVCRLHLNH